MNTRSLFKDIWDFVTYKRPEPKPEPDCVTVPLRELQESVRLLLEFAIERASVRIGQKTIDSAAKLTHLDDNGAYPKLSSDEEAELWKCHYSLSRDAYPATAESIKTQRDIGKNNRGKKKSVWKTLIPRWVRWLPLLLTVLVIALQIYILVLSNTLKNIESTDIEYTKLESSYSERFFENIKNNENAYNIKDYEKTQEVYFMNLNKAKRDLVKAKGDLVAHTEVLQRWTTPLLYIKLVPTPEPPSESLSESLSEPLSEPLSKVTNYQNYRADLKASSEIVLNALGLYILPLLAGVLGAFAYVLRHASSQIDEYRYTKASSAKYPPRLLLGALLGAIVGLFYTPDGDLQKSLGISLSAFAFLAGYSVELVFSFLDNLVETARKGLRDRENDNEITAQKAAALALKQQAEAAEKETKTSSEPKDPQGQPVRDK
jgi:hypothetical protein